MKVIITRKELTTYSAIVDLPEDEAHKLMMAPEDYEGRLSTLCRATNDNWQDAEDAEFEVTEHTED